MSHLLYQTECLVLESLDSGEADKFIYLFTKEFGLLGAKARGVRNLRSKLRYSLQSFSVADVTLVRGRDMWRLTGADSGASLRRSLSGEHFQTVSRILRLLKRLLPGEERVPGLYEAALQPVFFLTENSLPPEELKCLECLAVLRILKKLGYVGDGGGLKGLASGDALDGSVLSEVRDKKKKVLAEINRAIKASHL